MSMEAEAYMIAGFDITNNIVNGEKFSDWMFDTDEGSRLINYHIVLPAPAIRYHFADVGNMVSE